jgi:tetratricopeptide (TPR) repeat protein
MTHASVAALLERAAALERQGEAKIAEMLCRDALARQPNHPDGHELLGVLLYRKGDLANALTHLRRAARGRRNNPRALHNLGSALVEAGELGEAEKVLRDAARLGSHEPRIAQAYAHCLALNRRFDKAEAVLRDILRRYPESDDARHQLDNVLRELSRPDAGTESPQKPRLPPASSRKVISEEYRRMQEDLHRNQNYGVASVDVAPMVANFIQVNDVRELLDYGAGKGRLGQELRTLIPNAPAIHHYDPAVPEWSAPAEPRECVACIDVLEHIEPELLDNVLDDLKRVVLRLGLFTIATGPASKILADGRNAHLIQEPPAWWLPKLMERFELAHFSRVPQGFLVVVEAKEQSGE